MNNNPKSRQKRHLDNVKSGSANSSTAGSVLDLRNSKTVQKINDKPAHIPHLVESKSQHHNQIPTSTPNSYQTTTRTLVPQNKKPDHSRINANKQETQESTIDYFSFVFIKFFVPKPNLVLWQANLLRTILSPQTWLLLTLPLVLFQIKQYTNTTINGLLSDIKSVLTPGHFYALAFSLVLGLSIFLFSLVFRALVSAGSIFIRLREIDQREVSFLSAIRAASSTILRQCLNYILHVFILVFTTLILFSVARYILQNNNAWILSNKYQLTVAVVFIWVALLIMLYAKHWLQIGLFARSSSTRHIQLQSIKLLFSSALTNMSTSSISLLAVALAYGTIIFGNYYLVDFLIRQNSLPILPLIASSIATIIILTTLQYLQQNVWARQYFFAASKSSRPKELLYMNQTKKESIWPLIIVIAFCISATALFVLITWFFAPQIRGFMANWHAQVPTELKLSVPIRK